MFTRPLPTARLLATAATLLVFLLLAPVARVHAGLPEAVARVKPSVVAVGTFQKTRSPPFVFLGTGFAVGDGTLIATNAHIVSDALPIDGKDTMLVLAQMPGSREPQRRDAKVVAVDKVHDLALLRISGTPLPVVAFGNTDLVRDGQAVAFTGFPLGHALGFYPVTHRAVIASLTPIAIPGATAQELDGRVIRGLKSGPFSLFQLDANAYPGHSGSPLYDSDTSEVIGVVSIGFRMGAKDAAYDKPTGISFAVPAHYLQDLIRTLR